MSRFTWFLIGFTAVILIAVGVSNAAVVDKPSTPPGQSDNQGQGNDNGNGGGKDGEQPGNSANNPGSPGDDCSHGNSGQECRPDPQPDHGKDCEDHGNARGNEDHCAPSDDNGGGGCTQDCGGGSGGCTTDCGGGGDNGGTPSTEPTPTPTVTTTVTEPVVTAPPSTTNSEPVVTTSSPEVTQKALNKALKKQAAKAKAPGLRKTVTAGAPNQLPHTGFPAWFYSLLGGAMLSAGAVLRRLGR